MRTQLAATLVCALWIPLTAQADVYLIKSSSAPVRKAQNSLSRVLATARRGERVIGPELQDGQRWLRVSYRDVSGYVHAMHLQRERTGAGERNVVGGQDFRVNTDEIRNLLFQVTASGLKVRAAANDSSRVLSVAPNGARAVQIAPTDAKGWMRVSVNGVVGYVFAKHLQELQLPNNAGQNNPLIQAARRSGGGGNLPTLGSLLGGGSGLLGGSGAAPPAPWLAIARAEMQRGVNESTQAGRARIREYHQAATGTAYGASTAWCASFANWALGRAGQPTVPRANGAWARSFMNYGYPCPRPIPGAIAVFTRGDGGHVGFFVRDAGSSVIVLGGNQSNSVRESAYAKSRLLGYRWPTPLPPQ